MFDLLPVHQIHFQLYFEVKKLGKFPNASGDFIPGFKS